jgi:hypothetical protein
MTLPHSVPQFRAQPDTEQYKKDTSSFQLIRKDEASQKRNAEGINMQTSGDYGKYLLEYNTKSVRLNMGQSQNQFNETRRMRETTRNFGGGEATSASTMRIESAREAANKRPFYEPMNTERYKNGVLNRTQPIELTSATTHRQQQQQYQDQEHQHQDERHHHHKYQQNHQYQHQQQYQQKDEEEGGGGGGNARTNLMKSPDLFKNTLTNLDGAYHNRNRRDLVAATLPPRDLREGKQTATSNHRNGQKSKIWMTQLRQ